jgi:hypothetical protein
MAAISCIWWGPCCSFLLEGPIRNVQLRDIGTIGYTWHMTKTSKHKSTTQHRQLERWATWASPNATNGWSYTLNFAHVSTNLPLDMAELFRGCGNISYSCCQSNHEWLKTYWKLIILYSISYVEIQLHRVSNSGCIQVSANVLKVSDLIDVILLEGPIRNVQLRDIGTIGYTWHMTKTSKHKSTTILVKFWFSI